ncbi:MAG: hypothetical protein RLY31_849 [Bacteroidota bacterium]|jgi:phosphoribosylglycinamide formyltransferase-1
MKNIAIFASGTGSNARRIIEHLAGHPSVRVGLVVSNKPQAGVLSVASAHDIPSAVIGRADWEEGGALDRLLTAHAIGFVVLAGFLRLVPAWLVTRFERRMVNIHPSLLPAHGGKGMFGMHVHQAVKDSGATQTGITIHYVDEHYDQGDVIFQAACAVLPSDTPETIARKVQALEHTHFPAVVERLLLD